MVLMINVCQARMLNKHPLLVTAILRNLVSPHPSIVASYGRIQSTRYWVQVLLSLLGSTVEC